MNFAESTVVKLTKDIVNEATASEKRIELRDESVKGLVLRISPTGHKTYAIKFRSGGPVVTCTLGNADAISLKEARLKAVEQRALTLRTAIKNGPRSARIVTLAQLLNEAEGPLSQREKGGRIWRLREHRTQSDAAGTIRSVFAALLDTPVAEISAEQVAQIAQNHTTQPRSKDGQPGEPVPAPGAASRALSYLGTLFNWAAHRNEFAKIGSGRSVAVAAPDISTVARPNQASEPRNRHLDEQEIAAVFPKAWNHEGDDGRAALGLVLISSSRRSEVQGANWPDINFSTGVWSKRVKGGKTIPIGLPADVIDWLKGLPSYREGDLTGPIFRNTKGTRFKSWSRVTKKLREETGTKDWHRHDLRRTTAVYLTSTIDDAFPIWELMTHAQPKNSQTNSGAEVHKLFNHADEKGVMQHYASTSAGPVAQNRISRTRAMVSKVLQHYRHIAATAGRHI